MFYLIVKCTKDCRPQVQMTNNAYIYMYKFSGLFFTCARIYGSGKILVKGKTFRDQNINYLTGHFLK